MDSQSDSTSSPSSRLAFELEEVFEEEPKIITCVLIFTFIYILSLIVLVFGLAYLIVEVNDFVETLTEIKQTLVFLQKSYPWLKDGRP